MIYSAAQARGCSPHTAEEVVQEVMLALFEHRDVFRYDPAKGRFRDWLCAVVRNKVAEVRRRPAERAKGAGGDQPPEITDAQDNEVSPHQAWEAAFEESLLAVLLDIVRRRMNPQTYQARKTVLRRLGELGQTYRDNGHLPEQIKRALKSFPDAQVERSLTRRITQSMRSR